MFKKTVFPALCITFSFTVPVSVAAFPHLDNRTTIIREDFDAPYDSLSRWRFMIGSGLITTWDDTNRVVRVHGDFVDSTGCGSGHCGVFHLGETTYADSNYGYCSAMRINKGLETLGSAGSWSRFTLAHLCNLPIEDINSTVCLANYGGNVGWYKMDMNPPHHTIFWQPPTLDLLQEGVWIQGVVECINDTTRCYISDDGITWMQVGPASEVSIEACQIEIKVEVWNGDHTNAYTYDIEWDWMELYSFPDDLPVGVAAVVRRGLSWGEVKRLFQ
ncbi:MAG: hypothetical protein ABIH26_04520 [Candidatus Eisenbacteria bacterium]